MAQTFGAVAHGLATYRPGLPFAGVLANRVASPRHAEFLRGSLPPGMGWFGALPKSGDSLPERHLGLLRPPRSPTSANASTAWPMRWPPAPASMLPPPVSFAEAAAHEIPPLLAGKTIAIARDAAYGFIYPANLETLRQLGADLCFFSPVAGDNLPACDAVWLPGGYPELHAQSHRCAHAACGRHFMPTSTAGKPCWPNAAA